MKKRNRGFTLVELVIVIAVFSILLGILVPSLNSILGFRVKRAASSITAALDKTKTEASNRLVGEMKISKESDGWYITYYLSRGKNGSDTEDSPEKIAPSNVTIKYTTCKLSTTGAVESGSESTETEVSTGGLIITYNRETGAFRPIQTAALTQDEIAATLDGTQNTETTLSGGTVQQNTGKDITFKDNTDGNYVRTIIVSGGGRTRTITLDPTGGSYTVTVS